MAVVRLQAFGGAIPVSGDRALPDGFAAESLNTWLYSQELRGQRPPKLVKAVASTTRKILRLPAVGAHSSDIYHAGNVWVLFEDLNTDFALSPNIKDSYKRIYWASPSTGPRMNTYQNLSSGLVPPGYILGIPAPSHPAYTPVVSSVTGGSGDVETRAYLYTWVSTFGEESAPSLPVTASGFASGTWNIANILDPAWGEFTDHSPYAKKYLYRTSMGGESGISTYFRVGEVAAGVTTFADAITPAVLAGNLQLESTSWMPPPLDLQGLILMPNGFLIGWTPDKTIHFSEPYHPHAWPPEYQVTVEYPVVGLGVQGQTCVVCTEGYPTAISGTKPASTSLIKSTSNEPCLSRGSIVSTPNGVIYASQNGLVVASSAGIENVTEKLITREEWLREYSPYSLRSARYQNGYLSLRTIPALPDRNGFFLDPTALQVALTDLSELDNALNIFPDVWSGATLLIKDNAIWEWDPVSDDMLPILWRSKEFQLPKQMNMAVYSIYWDESRYAPNAIGTDIIATDVRVRFRAWADRRLVYDQPVPRNGKPVRLPSGFKSDIWQFEVRARAPIYSIHVATTERELVQV